MYVDSHCHLNFERERPGRDDLGSTAEIINRARQAKVSHMMTICCEISKESQEIVQLAEQHDNVWCTIGTHPHEAGIPEEQKYSAKDIADLTRHPKVVGIGETGLDYHYMNSDKQAQTSSFEKHLGACLETNLPVIVHTRDAEEDTAKILKKFSNDKKLKGLLHCFTSSQWLANQALELDFYISFSGIVTFKKSDELRDVAKSVPLDRILIETDSPFLAPEPYRGRANEPAYVVYVCEKLAELHGVTVEKMADITTENFFRLFEKAEQ